MRQILLPTVLATLVMSSLMAQDAVAQDAASLEATVRDYYQKLNNEDPSSVEYFLPGANQFPRTGLILTEINNDEATAREQSESGLDFDVELHHLNARVIGDTGIVTYYTTGTTTYPDGVVLKGTYRASAIAVWQGRQWRIAHLHLSQLKTVPE